MKIVFLAPYPKDTVPSQRFRFEQYFGFLKEKNITFTFYSFYTKWAFEALYSENQKLKIFLGTLSGYFLRCYHLLRCMGSDRILIHRELTPLGPPVFEWLLISIFGKKVIYDLDDAIWLSDKQWKNKWMEGLKWFQKISFLCKKSFRISAGNTYLAKYALAFNQRVILNPTTIDTSQTRHIIVTHRNDLVTIGWTGSHSTLKYLEWIVPLLQQFLLQHDHTRLLVICNRKPSWKINGMKFIYWNRSTEWEDLSQIQIGLMPLPDDPWTRGKGGFKILEYFSLGIPALASPVGINTRLIIPGETGYFCGNNRDWIHYLNLLIQNPTLRKSMGAAGKKLVEDQYSLKSNRDNFLRLFE